MSNNNNIVAIQNLFNEIQNSINNNDDPTQVNTKMTELKSLLTTFAKENNQEYPLTNSTEQLERNLVNSQNMSIQQKNMMLDTKLKQIELINQRNENKKFILTFLIILNVLIVVIFITLIVVKIMK